MPGMGRQVENFVLPHWPYVVCIYICDIFITHGVHGRFYGLDSKREMVILENRHRSLDSSVMENTVKIRRPKVKPGSTCSRLGY